VGSHIAQKTMVYYYYDLILFPNINKVYNGAPFEVEKTKEEFNKFWDYLPSLYQLVVATVLGCVSSASCDPYANPIPA